MAQQKPGVMLYFEMRNVFEELSNEKRNPGQRDSRLLRFPFPLTNGLHPFPKPANRKHQMIPIGIQLQPQQQQQPQQQPQQIVVICPRRQAAPTTTATDSPHGISLTRPVPFAQPLCAAALRADIYSPLQGVVRLRWQSRRRVDIRVAPTGACAKPQSKLSPPPGSNFVVFSAAQCLY